MVGSPYPVSAPLSFVPPPLPSCTTRAHSRGGHKVDVPGARGVPLGGHNDQQRAAPKGAVPFPPLTQAVVAAGAPIVLNTTPGAHHRQETKQAQQAGS